MKNKGFDAVKLKRELQEKAEGKLQDLDTEQQLQLLRERFRHIIKEKKKHSSYNQK